MMMTLCDTVCMRCTCMCVCVCADIADTCVPLAGTIMFQLRRRTEMPKKKKKRSSSGSRAEHGLSPEQRPPGPDRLPFLVELNPGTLQHIQLVSASALGSDVCSAQACCCC